MSTSKDDDAEASSDRRARGSPGLWSALMGMAALGPIGLGHAPRDSGSVLDRVRAPEIPRQEADAPVASGFRLVTAHDLESLSACTTCGIGHFDRKSRDFMDRLVRLQEYARWLEQQTPGKPR